MTEVSRQVIADISYPTFLNRSGKGTPILFLHGSGPGATGWSNWQYALSALGDSFECLAPDLVGFGQSMHPDPPPIGISSWMRMWIRQVVDVLDRLGIEKAHLVGNSLGGGLALHLLVERPDRFDRVVLMGAVGVPLRLTRELDLIWGFYEEPSPQRMMQMIRWFTYEEEVNEERLREIAQVRYEAAMIPEVRRSYEAMFPAPRQRHLDEVVVADAALRRIRHPVLLIHGRDDPIVPLETSLYLMSHLGGDVQLHIFGRCSHWVQIEYRERFHRLVSDFLGEGQWRG